MEHPRRGTDSRASGSVAHWSGVRSGSRQRRAGHVLALQCRGTWNRLPSRTVATATPRDEGTAALDVGQSVVYTCVNAELAGWDLRSRVAGHWYGEVSRRAALSIYHYAVVSVPVQCVKLDVSAISRTIGGYPALCTNEVFGQRERSKKAQFSLWVDPSAVQFSDNG
jgi:hypothetical protein